MRKTVTGTDDMDFNIVTKFEGYNSTVDPTNTVPGVLIFGSQNVYKKLSGTIASRPGLKRRGTADTTVAGVKSAFTWDNSSGRTLPIRVANSKLQVESDIVTSGTYVWYDLLTSLTTTAWIFDTWWNNTTKFDNLLFVGGNSNLYKWTGGLALISSTTINTIVLDRTIAASRITSTSGTVVINGNTYTYSGTSGSTLTGVGSDPRGEAVGSVVIEQVETNATTPASGFTNDFLRVGLGNRVLIGSYTSLLIYMSKKTSYTDSTFSTPRVVGDGDIITLDNLGKGIGFRDGHAWIGNGPSDWTEIWYDQLQIGTSLSENQNYERKPSVLNSAPKSQEFIAEVGNDIVCLSADNQVRIIGNFTNQLRERYPIISLDVADEFDNRDFTGGHLIAISKIIYITAPLSGIDYAYEIRDEIDETFAIKTERIWQPPQVRNISRFTAIGTTVYGHSNANPQIYQIWNTGQWYDDSPSGGKLPYSCIALFSYRNGGRRQGKINFDKFFIEGYAAQSSNINVAIYYDYQGSTSILTATLNSSDSPFPKTYSGPIPPSLGDGSLGDNPLGDGLNTALSDQALVPKFKTILGFSQEDCFEYAPMIYSQTADARWEILALGANEKLSVAEAIEIIK